MLGQRRHIANRAAKPNLLAVRCVVAMRGAGGVALDLDGALEEVRELPAQAFGAGWDDVSAARSPGLALES